MEKIQEIINKGIEEYKNKHKIIGYKQKVIESIRRCKTGKLGAHKYQCDECGYEEIAYNSCRNRHCPNCQTGKKLKWIEARKEEVLNTKYYHVVFTIPSEIYLIALQNQEKIYKILFKASSETLQELAEDDKYLGAEIGFFSILHTWGQNLMYHPHVHLVVTGGGLSDTNKWVEKEGDFFIPVKVMSKVFRGKFLSYMRKEKLEYYGENKYLENPASYNELIQKMYKQDWVVYCKEPFKNAECVIQYLGRYTHRVAISNERIIKIEGDEVTFKWRDYKDNNKMKEMTIKVEEFIRRFLIHILPPKFMKIRYYGILGNRNKKKKLLKCKILTRTKIYKKERFQLSNY
ncbi:MAG: IS91 family transposase [Clostridia bacterium]